MYVWSGQTRTRRPADLSGSSNQSVETRMAYLLAGCVQRVMEGARIGARVNEQVTGLTVSK